jgi:cephalosporin-C deacetylase-like acetyl esterase
MVLNGYQHMVLDYYVDKVRAISKRRSTRLNRLKTPTEALEYQEEVLKAINKAFSPIPPKTPLKPQITGTLKRNRYRIEKIIFESRPDCFVTGNLYIPDKIDGKAPGVIAPCGHSDNGKACDLYQGFCQRLAVSGFVVLIYDPFNQGERDQYINIPDRDAVQSCCPAHNMMGKQLELIGEYFGMWRVWDGIRALDYLLERPEVDSTRIGLTGNSGGGTLTTWLWAVDDRFTMAAPGCFVTTFLHNLENELPADCEQYPPGVIGEGLEMADFFIARAPKPVLLLGQKYDYFDRRGLLSAYEDLQRFYEVLQAPRQNIACSLGPQGHGYSSHNQEAMVDFFCFHAGMKSVRIPETEVIKDEDLYATAKGNVILAGSKPIYEMIAEKSDELSAKRKPLNAKSLRKHLISLLNVPKNRIIPHYRVLRPTNIAGNTYARYAIDTESRIQAILKKRMAKPQYAGTLDVNEVAHLYIPHISSEDDIINDTMAKDLINSNELYLLDVRGLGESTPEDISHFFQPYGMDYMFHGHGLLLGESYLGRRVYDALSTIDLLLHEGAREIRLYGRGQGSIIALFTAIIQDQIVSVTLKNSPESYESWVHAPLVSWASANFLRNVLKYFDLPDCMEIVKDKLTIIEPWDVDMKPM